ncbi:MAG: CocE/NonD family hydrolase [Gammaproteobacteria bacterium]|nr:CocE/NonD family hydrolase [Gammaproteobacteria bacterium]
MTISARLMLSLMFVFFNGCQTYIAHSILPHEGIRPAQYDVWIERDVTMTTSDNVRLVANIYHPQGEQKTPTILVRIPYSDTFKNTLGTDAVGRFWATRGYTVVIQGTRGRYKSDGRFYPLVHERRDGIETLAWLAQQAWFNGKLGMWGGSAFGHTQWVLADQKDPGVNAFMIQIASSDFHGMFYPGGALSLESALFWAMRSRGAQDENPSLRALERGFNGFPLNQADDRAVGDIGFFNDWVSHAMRDAYWTEIDGHERARTLQAPVLLMAGWYDPFLPTQLKDFQIIRREAIEPVAQATQLIIGPWTHADAVRFPDGSTAGDYRPASLAPSIAWFDRHLMGKNPTMVNEAPVRIYVMGINRWRNEQEWPLARTRFTSYYLHSAGHANSASGDGRLTSSSPISSEPPDRFQYDPLHPVPSRGGAMLGPRAGMTFQNEIENRSDVLVYSTDTLEQAMEVTGPIRLVLHVATNAPHTDFTAKLVDVYPDKGAYNISNGILRRAYSGEQTTEIEIELWPTSRVFDKGHQLRLEISSSDFPRFDRNPNTGRPIPSETESRIADQSIYHGTETPSRLILPLIPVDEKN